MRIETDGNRVFGFVDYNGRGETDVIRLTAKKGGVTVDSSVCLPVRHAEAKLVLACMNEAFQKAELLANA